MLAAVSASQMRFETDNGLLSVLPVPLPDTTRRIGDVRAGDLPSPATQALLRLFISRFRTGPFNVYPRRIGYLLVARLLKRLQRLPAHRGVNMRVGYADHRAHFSSRKKLAPY